MGCWGSSLTTLILGATALAGAPRLHPDPIRAGSQCRKAIEQSKTLAPEPRLRAALTGCKRLFVERGCQLAAEEAANAPSSKIVPTLVAGCREAYCPVLPEPRPSLCHRNLASQSDVSFLEEWSEFVLAVGKRDFGAMPVEVSEVMHQLVAELRRKLMAAERPRDAVAVYVRLADDGRLIVSMPSSDGGVLREWCTDDDPDAETLNQLVSAVRSATGQSKAVSLSSAPQVRFSSIKAVVETLRDAGGYQIYFSVLNDGGSAP